MYNEKLCVLCIAAIILSTAAIILVSTDKTSSDAASTTFTVDGIYYEVTSGTDVRVTSTCWTARTLTLVSPVEYGGIKYFVMAIGDGAFFNCRALMGSLIIPDSVTYIGIMHSVNVTDSQVNGL